MVTMTGGQAAVRTLVAHGVTDVFGLPGVQNDWFYNAIYDEGQPFDLYTTRHEQGAAYMALGYAATSDRVGVMSVVPGPGLLNAAAGIATGYGLCARMVALVGQVPSPYIDRGFGFLHEVVDQPSIVRNITKWQGRATSPALVSPLIAEAFRQTTTADPRPTMVEIPPDVLEEPATGPITQPLPVTQPPVDHVELDRAVAAIEGAQRPLIVVGGGALDAGSLVRALAERIEAPVTSHRRGKGVIDERHPLSIPFTVAHGIWPDVDVVIGIGTRMQMQLHDWGTDDAGPTQVWINPERAAAHRMSDPDVVLAARAEEVLPLLLDRLDPVHRDGMHDDLAVRRAADMDRISSLEPQLSYVAAVRQGLGEEGILVTDLTQVGYITRIAYAAYHPRTFVFPGYPGTLGYAFPAALGAKVANPDTSVVCTVGDGGFMFTATELATAVRYGIGTVTVVFDDARYGNVQLMQREFYDGRVHATDLTSPDFVAMAESFGARGLRVDGADALAEAIDVEKATPGPTVIVVRQGDWPNPWPFLRAGRVRG